ncbi:sensor histidine kinase [Haloferula sargassicola]|uniref:histidine kinase n=1 Tax=Haloferula sargassicola TaxID=490096 RepID=A0ABP9UNN3_9BACT
MISIRRRLTLLLCLAVGALFIATGLGVFLAMRGLLQKQFDETLTAKARALITASEIDDGDFEIDLTVQDFAGFGRGGEDYFEIRRGNGELFLLSPSLEQDGFRITEDPRAGTPGDEEPDIFAARLGDGRPARFYLQAFKPKDDKKKRFRDLHLVVASPSRGMHLQLALLATVLTVAGAAALVAMVPVIRLGLRRGLDPLDRLSAEVKAIRPESLHRRLDADRLPPELAPVALNLNDWLARLEASFERERRFSSHAAHELRTPLAELKSMAELGATWPEEATSDRCREILGVAGELESLLDKLALLARADAGRQPVTLEEVPLAQSIDDATQRLAPQASERRIRFDPRIDDGPFHTDPVLWSTILHNLVGNAVAHAPPESTVALEASPRRFWMTNPAPDLDEQDVEHVFERFWRKDESRTGHGHSGLGMSIVKACVELLGGHVSADLTPAGHLQIKIAWPDPSPVKSPRLASAAARGNEARTRPRDRW